MTTPTVRGRARNIQRGWQREQSPFHEGEQRVQRRVGVREQVERAGRNMIHEQLPDQHRELFEALPLLVVGSLDPSGRPWASLLAGEPGFIHSPSPKLLRIQAQPLPGDPLAQQLRVGAPLGLLGIQLETRRRNRANGHIAARSDDSFSVEIAQSFGNCQQYIQAREPHFDATRRVPGAPQHREGPYLSQRARELLERTDTLFIATASTGVTTTGVTTTGVTTTAPGEPSAEGVDVSHRGGRPGFVRVEHGATATRLTLPDFRGNFSFNTLGNLEVNPRAGIVCADFSTGDVLTLTGSAHAIWDGPELAAFEGADRLLRFELDSGLFLERALPLCFQGLSPSPDLVETGTWPEARLTTSL